MVHAEIETPSRTEARLRAVLRAAEVDILRALYAWEPLPDGSFPGGIKSEAVALTRDQDGWSQLVPATGTPRTESWALFCFHFGPSARTDGFTDWFAGYLRRRVGSRVMVANGLNGREGGLYGYWGVPARQREQVIRELAILTTSPVTGVRAVGLL